MKADSFSGKAVIIVIALMMVGAGVFAHSLANADEENEVLWEPKLLFEGDYDEVDELAYSPDGETVALGGRVLKLFSVEDREIFFSDEDAELQDQLETSGMDYSPDGSMLALVGGGNDGVFDAEDLTEIQPIAGHQSHVVFAPNGERLATARWEHATIRIWEADNGGEFEEVAVHEDEARYVNDIVFSPDGQYLAAGFYDGKVLLFDMENQELVYTHEFEESGGTNPLSFSPDGTLAVKAPDIENKIYFFNLANGNLEMDREMTTHIGIVDSMDYSPDGSYFAYGAIDKVVIYDTDNWTDPLYELEHDRRVRDLSFCPDSEKLGVADDNFYLYQVVPDLHTERLAGLGRFATAVEISKESFEDEAEAVVLATGLDFPDALAGVPLAYAKGGPLLLTHSNELPDETADEIDRLLTEGDTVYVLGGDAAVSEKVAGELDAKNYEVERLAGQGRFDTAVKIAEEVADNPAEVFLTTGLEFPDAVAASGPAAMKGAPILLTRPDELSADTEGYLEDNEESIEDIHVIGGEAAVSDGVKKEAGGTNRVSGDNRWETGTAIAKEFFEEPVKATLATGLEFPDALAGGVYAALNDAPVLLTNDDELPGEVEAYFREEKTLEDVFVFGGDGAIADYVLRQIEGIQQ